MNQSNKIPKNREKNRSEVREGTALGHKNSPHSIHVLPVFRTPVDFSQRIDVPRGIDFVHTGFDTSIGSQIRHKGVADFVSKFTHRALQLMQNCRSNFIFTGKGFIQFQLRDRRSDHIKHIRLDLTPWIGQTIISGICAFAQHTELHRHGDLVKYRVRQCVRESEQSNTNGGGG